MAKEKIAFVGAGSMAEAIIGGILTKKLYEKDQIIVTNRSNKERLNELKEEYGVIASHDKKAIINEASIIILAMKPKDVASGLELIKPYLTNKHLLISVIAGISIQTITDLLNMNIPIVRAMPNTSASIGQSATAISLGSYATEEHENLAVKLFKSIGTVSVVSEEKLHAVTGLSGSGPAYVYYLVESMEQAAVNVGLDADIAKDLIIQTLIGAAEMLKSSSKEPATLRKQVMSPGGTTEAGLKVLEEHHFQDAVINCIKRATERSGELGEELASILVKQN